MSLKVPCPLSPGDLVDAGDCESCNDELRQSSDCHGCCTAVIEGTAPFSCGQCGAGYADLSWNVVTGCRHGCAYCYARRFAERLKAQATLGDDCTQPANGLHEIRCPAAAVESYRYGFAPTFHSHRLREPQQRRKPSVIFACDMGDLFGAWVPAEWIAQVVDVIRATPRHRFLLLTKHPGRYDELELPRNAWAGTTVTGDADRGRLTSLNAALPIGHPRWVSYEPALGPFPVDLLALTDWITVGAQTGPGAKRPDPRWIRDLLRAHEREGEDAPRLFFKDNLVWPEPRPREYPEGLVVTP